MTRFLVVLGLALGLLAFATPAVADEGWVIKEFAADYTVQPDGTVGVVETIRVDFGSQQKHGIFRDLIDRGACPPAPASGEQRTYACPEGSARLYNVRVSGVTDAGGKPVQWLASRFDMGQRIRIGDPARTVSGAQTYRVTYTVQGALDAYASHDELFWNATGGWPVAIEQFRLALHLPPGVATTQACFQGPYGSTEPCRAAAAGDGATFDATRRLPEGENVTIVAGWQKGLVAVPAPSLGALPAGGPGAPAPTVDDSTTWDGWDLGGAGAVALASLLGIVALWWRHGRDRSYKTLYYLTNDPSEETRPLLGPGNVVVEFTPPDDLRPAEMGLILDERADTLDVTATIIDLAVRGYLHITEIPKKGWFGHTDWRLAKTEKGADDLASYESKLFDSLFGDKTEVQLSDLKYKFAKHLEEVEELLYRDGMKRKWFSQLPGRARANWLGAGIGVVIAGFALSIAGAAVAGRWFIPAPLIPAGIVLAVLSRAMARRTATGSEALRRVLGFRLYITTAETRRQEFNEQQGIFARYLPYAIVFGCVRRWAKAFEGLDAMARDSTAGWYTGVGGFEAVAFASGLQGFANSVSSALVAAPPSSRSGGFGGGGGFGGSGFSGGFSGGGGGGGGGGSW